MLQYFFEIGMVFKCGDCDGFWPGAEDHPGIEGQEPGRNGQLLLSGGDVMRVKSSVKLNMARINELTQAAVTALEKTGEALHTEVVQAQVMPFETGHLQEDATFVDYSESSQGKVSLVTSTPYARRLYYHPEYDFQTDENPFAGGEWYEPWLPGGISEDWLE